MAASTVPVDGYVVDAGTRIVVHIIAINRNPHTYEHPNEFRPERFLGTRPETYAWVPFGGGVKRCLGAAFSMRELITVVHTLLREGEFTAVDEKPERIVRRSIHARASLRHQGAVPPRQDVRRISVVRYLAMGRAGRVQGKVALITGGSRGMGAAHAQALVSEGARVVIGDILDDQGQAVAEKLGGSALFVHLDVTNPDQWDWAVEAAVNRFGRLDALVNNAGIVKLGPLRGSSLADWQQVIDVNLTGAYLGMRAAIEPMIHGGGGSIVNISSVEGMAGSAHLHAYVAAKFGLRGITKSAAVELASYGIRVNSVHPGLVHTPLSAGVTEEFMAPIPMRRGAAAEEVAAFVLFLVSDESAYATGSEFVVDGGLTSYVPVKM